MHKTSTFQPSRLREARLKRGFSLEQLGELIGVKAASVSRWENGENIPRHKRAKSLAVALRIPVSELFVSQ